MLISKYKQWFWEDEEYEQFMDKFIESIAEEWIEYLKELEEMITFRVKERFYPDRCNFNNDMKEYLTHLIIAMTHFFNNSNKFST